MPQINSQIGGFLPTTPSMDSASKLRAALLKGDVWQQPDRTPSSHPPAAKIPPAEALLPAMSAAAEVASAWVERQDERAACCPDWHERSALSTPHTPAGQRLDAVLHVVEDAVDAQIAKLEKEVSRGKDAGASYSVAHLLAWLRQAQERSAMADRRARAAEVKAKRNADALAERTAELAAQQRETEQATARIQSLELEIESLKSNGAAVLAARATAAELSLAAASIPGAATSVRSVRSAARRMAFSLDDDEKEEVAVAGEAVAVVPEAALAGEAVAVAVVPPSPPSSPNRADPKAPFVAARGLGRIKSRAGSSARGDARGSPSKKKPHPLSAGNGGAPHEDVGGDDRHFPTGDDRLASAWVALRRLQTSLLLSATLLDQASSERTAEAGADATTDLAPSDGGFVDYGFVDYGSLGSLLGERFASAAAATAVAARDLYEAPPNRVHRARGATGAVPGTSRPLDEVASVEEMLRRLQVLLRLHATNGAMHATNGATEAAADDDDDDAGEAAAAAAARRAALTLHTASLLPPIAAELAGLASRAETLRLQGAQTHARLFNGRNTLALWHCAAVSEGLVRRIVSAWRCEARLSRLRVELLDERDYRLELNAELQACKAEKASLQAQLGALRHASSLALERIDTQLDELTTAPARAVHLSPRPEDASSALAERSTPHAHQADHDAHQDVSSAQTEPSLPAPNEPIRELELQTHPNPNPKASYEQIRELQTLTGRPLKDCKQALNENSCDVEAAAKALARAHPHLESPAEAFSRAFRTAPPTALAEVAEEDDDLVVAVPWANPPLASGRACNWREATDAVSGTNRPWANPPSASHAAIAAEVAAAESDVTDSEAKEVAMIAAEMEAAAMEAAAIEAAATDGEAADAEAADTEAADATEVQAEVVVATPPRQVEPLAKRTPERGPPPPSPAVRMAAVQAAAAFLLAAEAEAEEEEEEEAETDWTPTRPEAVSKEEADAKAEAEAQAKEEADAKAEAEADAKAEAEDAPLRAMPIALPIALPATAPQLRGAVQPPTATAPPTPTPSTPADAPSAAGSEAPTSHSSQSVQERRKRLLLVSQASRILSRG
jgi:hypothetical protein